MITQSKTIRIASLAIVFLFTGFHTSVWGQAAVPAPGTAAGSVGDATEGTMVVTGRIICADCTRAEVRKTQPHLLNLYELSHDREHLVMKIDEASTAAHWEAVVGLSHQVTVRANDKVWQALTAEENLFQKVELVGILANTRTLDVNRVKVNGINISALEDARVDKG